MTKPVYLTRSLSTLLYILTLMALGWLCPRPDGPALWAGTKPASELDYFMPDGIDRLYQRYPCKIAVDGPCTFWVAGDQDPRHMIFYPAAHGRRADPSPPALVRAVLPDTWDADAVRMQRAPKFFSNDPETFLVQDEREEGKVQIVVRPDQVMVTWMPGGAASPGFPRVTARVVPTPPPTDLRVLRVSNQPDVIMEDRAGYLWFSAWGSEIYRIDPETDVVQPMTGGTATGTPDGLFVDSSDRVWFGANSGRYMGMLTADTPLVRYEMPYTPALAAIPCEAPDGRIWITDHPYNRLTEFDPVAGQWGRSVRMPFTPAYIVQCLREPDNSAYVLWMTLWQANSLGRLDLATSEVERFPIPCAPAFLTFDPYGYIWATCWNNGNIIQFDPVSLTGVEYVIPNGAQAGGISVDPYGRIVFTQNTLGRVAVLDPWLEEVYTYEFSPRPLFKDSVLVDRRGIIWAPSPSGGLVGKIIP